MSATQFTCKNDEVSPKSLISSNAVNSSKNSRKNEKRVLFPVKLYNILTHIASKDPNEAIAIGWDPHGRSFRVNRSRLFEKFVLPKYFNMTKMKSFIRQLNLYNFTRITAGKDEGSYYHVNFLRGHLEHVVKVRREKTRGAPEPNYRGKSDFDPMLYLLPPLKMVTESNTELDANNARQVGQQPITKVDPLVIGREQVLSDCRERFFNEFVMDAFLPSPVNEGLMKNEDPQNPLPEPSQHRVRDEIRNDFMRDAQVMSNSHVKTDYVNNMHSCDQQRQLHPYWYPKGQSQFFGEDPAYIRTTESMRYDASAVVPQITSSASLEFIHDNYGQR